MLLWKESLDIDILSCSSGLIDCTIKHVEKYWRDSPDFMAILMLLCVNTNGNYYGGFAICKNLLNSLG